jgi:hypothetical protein
MEKGQIVSVELKGKTESKVFQAKVIEYTDDTVWVLIGNMVKLQFNYPSGDQFITGVKSEVKGVCRVISWEGTKP